MPLQHLGEMVSVQGFDSDRWVHAQPQENEARPEAPPKHLPALLAPACKPIVRESACASAAGQPTSPRAASKTAEGVLACMGNQQKLSNLEPGLSTFRVRRTDSWRAPASPSGAGPRSSGVCAAGAAADRHCQGAGLLRHVRWGRTVRLLGVVQPGGHHSLAPGAQPGLHTQAGLVGALALRVRADQPAGRACAAEPRLCAGLGLRPQPRL